MSLDNKQFRRHAHELVDWIADYLDNVADYPAKAQVKPGEIAARLPEAPPETAEPMDAILADFRRDILPGMTHWQHPSFFAYFPANNSYESILGELLGAAMGAQGMIWETSPAVTELETRVMQWLAQLLGLGEGWSGVIQDSASSATLCALLTARERATGYAVNEAGLQAQDRPLTVYCSAETHSSIEKGAKIAGFGRANLRQIAADDSYAMRIELLREAIDADIAAGARPAIVIATLGTTGAGGFDDLRAIGEICRTHDIFLHVDAAWAGSACVLPDQRWMLDGIEFADSFVFNPHKWLFTNFDCTAYFVREPDALIGTLTIMRDYLAHREMGQAIDYRDWQVPLGRRFRALKLWFVLRGFGAEGLRQRIGDHIRWAQDLAKQIKASEDFVLEGPNRLALIGLRHAPPGTDLETQNDLNRRLAEALNDDGRLYLTPGNFKGRAGLRLSIGQTNTTADDVQRAWSLIQEMARALK
ncbi:MAG: pyridoxal-dependent decarboxylase [Alphaproteobacteria bacterium]